jgi:hypothetical protein
VRIALAQINAVVGDIAVTGYPERAGDACHAAAVLADGG